MNSRIKLISIACAIALVSSASLAATIYSGNDPGAGPTNPRPNADSAAAAFNSAAAALGPVSLITFESLPVGQFSSKTIAPGVNAIQSNYDTSLGGIVVNGYATPAGAPTGYNTTPGGTKFLAFVPLTGVSTARLDSVFSTPVQAWGAYVVGLDPGINGSVAVQFTDGTAVSYPLTESSPAGPQFFGFTSVGGSIAQITLLETGLAASRDIYGVDDMRFVAIPEPSSILLAVVALSVLPTRRHKSVPQNRA